jgi:hypothetical protein
MTPVKIAESNAAVSCVAATFEIHLAGQVESFDMPPKKLTFSPSSTVVVQGNFESTATTPQSGLQGCPAALCP